ncbi:hypothetical protein N0V93_002193 [Gnomoniopsis smithogilvyi]|uniref:Heterokaryon incompatibility domain-containing protein n=1 Tax=Gnomoniopsis smithogilvyi TaxID=1191159 RepID=A0A9W8YUB6_9PEZI|nr:hypothetical protein N0V93_002193 [Gnomoniopsis smithogilvyi]
MRLLHTNRLEVVSIRDDAIPAYAILSHTWGDDEVSLQDMQSFGSKLLSPSKCKKLCLDRPGLSKIVDAANLARSQAYHWIWIDTCCIDKTSSAELSEAINSMYRLYQDSKICYVYLQDAPSPAYQRDAREAKLSMLRKCRWAKRGWTLQELIAPNIVHFYSEDWTYQGQRGSSYFAEALSEVTGIEVGVLTGHVTAAEVSVANRMKWASERQTTRPEDIAYCLMGLFGVNMPLLYGEGAVRAFIRLQEQILKVTDDQSIFAWQLPHKEEARDMHGLLADSPSYFISDRSIYTMSIGFQSMTSVPWSMTNKGLQVQLFDCPDPDGVAERYLAILDCFLDQRYPDPQEELSPAIYLQRLWGDQYTRVHAHVCLSVGRSARESGSHHSFFVKQDPAFVLPEVGVAPHLLDRKNEFDCWGLMEVYPEGLSSVSGGDTFKLSLSQVRGIQGLFRFRKRRKGSSSSELVDVAIVLHRTVRAGLEAVCFLRPFKGEDVKQAYNTLHSEWKGSHIEKQDHIVGEFRHQIPMVVELKKAVRFGRGLYLLNLFELRPIDLQHSRSLREIPALDSNVEQSTVPETAKKVDYASNDTEEAVRERILHPLSESKSLETGIAKQARAASGDGHVEARVEDDLRPLLDPMQPSPSSRSPSFRSKLELGIRDTRSAINPAVATFCRAILDGNELEVARLLQSTDVMKINSVLSTYQNLRALHFTSLCLTNQSNVVTMLLEKGANPLAETEKGLTVLHLASIFANGGVLGPTLRSVSKHKYEAGCIPKESFSSFRSFLESTTGTRNTALHLAAVYCSAFEFEDIIHEILKTKGTLLEEWSEFELREEREMLFSLQNSRGQTVFQTAAAAGNSSVVQIICQSGSRAVTKSDSMSRTSLWYAAYGGQVDILKMVGQLCPGYSDVSDDHGLTALHVACWKGNTECVKELLKQGASVWRKTQKVGLTPIHYASLFGRSGCLEAMVESVPPTNRQATIDVVAQRGETGLFQAIHLAAANGWLDCVMLLARNGASTMERMSYSYALSQSATAVHPGRPFKGLVKVSPSTPEEMATTQWMSSYDYL